MADNSPMSCRVIAVEGVPSKRMERPYEDHRIGLITTRFTTGAMRFILIGPAEVVDRYKREFQQ